MEMLYTCYNCSFPFKAEEDKVPAVCPSCGASPDQYLSEPFTGMENRRIHVDPPQPDPNWDPMNTAYHHPKFFPANTRHGRIRRFVLPYDDAKESRDFYTEVFGWDIIDTKDTDPNEPLMFSATGPGNSNWEPSVPSFGYGYLRSRESDVTGRDPRFVIEVDNLDDALQKVQEYGGTVLRDRYTEDEKLFAVIEDSEGNALYLWQTPDTVTWDEPESQTMSRTRSFTQYSL